MTTTKSIPLIWEESNVTWRKNKYLSDESIAEMKKLIADNFGQEFAELLKYHEGGIEVRSYYCKQIGRDKAGMITKIELYPDCFDLTKHWKKYEEMARIFYQHKEWQKKRADYNKALSLFCSTVNILGVDVESDFYDRITLTVGSQSVNFHTSDDGTITDVTIKVPSYNHGTYSQAIEKLQHLEKIEKRLQAELIGKNIYNI